jgi:acetyl-CoA carboxylase biotin carboxyl carrier protein
LNLKELKEILQLLVEREITEFELEEEGMKLRIRRAGASPPEVPALPTPIVISSAPVVPGGAPSAAMPAPGGLPTSADRATAPAATAAAVALAGEEEEVGLAVVKSPIVGTFYRSPDANSPAFVNLGDQIRVGQVLCIIEAMKLMNEIEAEVAGEVVKIHHENGQPVQYGEPLFTIRPA